MSRRRNALILGAVISLLVLTNLATYFNATAPSAPQVRDVGENIEPHYRVQAWIIKADGTVIQVADTLNVYTNIGKNWTRNELGDTATASTNVARHISLSESSSTPAATWTILPTEITTGGCDRNSGTFTALSGNGSWKIEYTFSVGASFTIRCTGLHWIATDNSDNNMIAAAQFSTPATVASGDSLLVRWSNSVSGS